MADVFISYRNMEDRRRLVQRFATILRAYDISVWWDHGLEAGASYADQIMRELDQAKLVIPFWCEESVVSQWVLKEAEVGRAKLLPLRLQRIPPPDAFEAIHSVHLESWNGSILDPVLDGFVRDICERLGKSSRIAADSKTELSRLPPIKPLRAARPAAASSRPAPGKAAKSGGGAGPAIAVVASLVVLAGGAGAVYAFDPMGWLKPAAEGGPASGADLSADAATLASAGGAQPATPPASAPAVQPPAPAAAGAALPPATAAPTPGQSEAAKAWAAVNLKSASSLRAFIAANAAAPEATTAATTLTALETAAWSNASKANTLAAYDAFLKSFPDTAKPPAAHSKDAISARAKLAAAPSAATPPAATPPAASTAAAEPAPPAPPMIWGSMKDKPNFSSPRSGRNLGADMVDAYPAASIRAQEEGTVTVTVCTDSAGKVSNVQLVKSSGFERLDAATLKFLPRSRFTPARLDGIAIGVCGYQLELAWKLADPAPAVAPTP
jgi:TonB family protein